MGSFIAALPAQEKFRRLSAPTLQALTPAEFSPQAIGSGDGAPLMRGIARAADVSRAISNTVTAPMQEQHERLTNDMGLSTRIVSPQQMAQPIQSRAPITPFFAPQMEATTQRIQGETANLERLQREGSGVHQILHPVDGHKPGLLRKIGGVAAGIGDVALSVLAPGIATVTPGTTLHHQMELGQANNRLDADMGRLGQDVTTASGLQRLQMEPQQADDAHQVAQAQLGNYASEIYSRTHPAESWTIHDTDAGPVRINSRTGDAQPVMVNGAPVPAKQHLTQSQAIMGPDGKPHTYMLDEHGNTVRDLGVHYERPINVNTGGGPKQMVYVPDGNGGTRAVEVRPGMTIPMGASKAPGGPKIAADEQKRADLAQNLNENIDALEEIIGRRPELVGKWRGRMTQISNLTGTDDPDIAQLFAIEHQLGMVAQGAHGMRSAQGITSAAQSLTNAFHNSPAATKAALEAARRSVQTFLSDSQAPGQARTAAAAENSTGTAQHAPSSHTFSLKAWKAANPQGDTAAARKAAKAAGYEVTD